MPGPGADPTTGPAPSGPPAVEPVPPAPPAPVPAVVASAGPGPEPESGVRPMLVIGLLVASAAVMILNETVMSVALPRLITELRVPVTTAQWLTSGFMLTMAVVIPITGWLMERLAPRRLYVTSMGLFCTGTLVCALAPGFGVLMTGRVVQAGGTAMIIPLLMTSVIRLVPVQRRGATMGTITVVIAVAPAVGPTLSGVVLSTLGWRWTFWIVLAIALVAVAAGVARLRMPVATRRVPLDLPSVPLSALAFGGLVVGLSGVGEAARGGHPPSPALTTAIGVAALAIFVWRQLRLSRDDRALLDPRPLAVPAFALPLGLMLLAMMALFGVLILLPLYLQDVMRTSPLVTGLAVLPGGLVMGLLGPVVGRLYDRWGPRPLVVPGAVVLAGTLWMFTTVRPATGLAELIALHVVLVVGVSLMMTPLMTDAMGALPPDLVPHGSAIMSTLQQVAGAAGTALFVTVMALFAVDPVAGADPVGARAAFLSAALIATVAVPLTLLIGRRGTTGPAGQPPVEPSSESSLPSTPS